MCNLKQIRIVLVSSIHNLITILCNLKEVLTLLSFTYILNLPQILTFIYHFIRIPLDIKNIVNCLTNLIDTPSNSLDVVPFSEYIVKDFVSILECYEFNKDNVDICMHALALDDARLDTDLDIINVYKTKHIMKAVRITIYYTLIKLVADAIIPKYFSRMYFDSEMLFGELCFEKIASSSYGIGKSVSLGLTLVVV